MMNVNNFGNNPMKEKVAAIILVLSIAIATLGIIFLAG
jgi:hypothetical protein